MSRQNRHIEFSDLTAGRPDFDDLHHDEPVGMPGIENVSEHPKDKSSQPENPKFRIRELLDGTILVRENMIRQLPYVIFLTLLGVIYIGNRFHAEKMVRQISELKTEVANLRSEQITTTSELMNISRPSEVAALVASKNLGLKESMEPPKKIKRR